MSAPKTSKTEKWAKRVQAMAEPSSPFSSGVLESLKKGPPLYPAKTPTGKPSNERLRVEIARAKVRAANEQRASILKTHTQRINRATQDCIDAGVKPIPPESWPGELPLGPEESVSASADFHVQIVKENSAVVKHTRKRLKSLVLALAVVAGAIGGGIYIAMCVQRDLRDLQLLRTLQRSVPY